MADILCNFCGTANQPTESFCEICGAQLIPLLNQRYRILNQLGAGGFGAVYRVEDTKLANRQMAAKKLQPIDLVSSKDYQDALQAFQREAQILATLKHPNLPTIHDYFQENNDSYLIMEYIDGQNLEKYLKKPGQRLLPITEVMSIGIELATVLDYLHTRTPPIIFRDLKPANIMLTPIGQVYLIDFGIARHFKPGQSKDTTSFGSAGYAPPEQYGKAQTTVQSDIYSLGAIIHQMLTGDDPADSPFNFAPLPGQMLDLQQLVQRMLNINAQQRPASASEVKQQFQQIQQKVQQSTQLPAQPQKPTIPPTSKVGAAPLPAVNAALPQSAIPTQPGIPQTVPPTQPIAPAPVLPPKARGERYYSYSPTSRKTHTLAWSPDGTYLAAAGEEPAHVCVWSGPVDNIVRTYQQHSRAINALAWSPDSQRVASASNDYTVQIWEVHLGNQLGSYTQHKHWVNALAWSPDGALLASGDTQHQVHLWDAQSCQPRLVYRGHQSSITALAFAPGGAHVASADESGSIQVWGVAGGKLLTTYTGHRKTVSALSWSPDGKQIVSGSWDKTLHIWESANGQHYATYTGHHGLVKAVSWSQSNGRIASAGRDKTVQIWDPQSGNTLYTYHGHISNINALAWSPLDGKIASAGDGAEIHVWQAI